ncbi:adenylate/guanylate cyclase domain-containing protein [Flagellimonas lutimaris]|uniref:Adenylate/guanylate cyclase domain-containing protein n=1 Tax=Flagellimonas lutimaris TaxID=475082 RepID=A0A3A1N9V4_9FLAO|nr:adenylate/guanylate cyclase domain-containing protein [Allomuricauda lutimaris]RIV35427.1 adenylate/guanylate cyclase domain-containing protein [Allomuricauda lutimaris]|tara:strand:- start:530 stop:1645 length:1116 start_codon:yes stop_codon:yes gene_type:complete
MALLRNPKTGYYIKRILPFGIIWLVLSWFILLIESMATEYQNQRPETDITITWNIFLFASLAVFLVGIAMGAVEVLWLGKRFKRKAFWQKILYKMGFYLLFMLVINLVTFPIAASIELKTSLLDTEVWHKFSNYITSTTFLSTMVSLAFSIFLSLLYSGISEHLGHNVLLNFFSGKYHSPKEESRIFMFVDMKSSTSLAEKLGHQNYFKFLRDYYNQLSDAIIQYKGEVYQYIGDEIVITWEQQKGLKNQNCLRCFYAMKKSLHKKSTYFEKTYGMAPSFRAGLHMGKVTTGEIGALKKEIFFTGDVLNVTARIQKLCKSFDRDLIVSTQLAEELISDELSFEPLGSIELEGRKESSELFAPKPTPDGLMD